MSNAFAENRIGRFVLRRRTLRDCHQAGLMAIFRGMVVLDTRASFASDTIEYTVSHPDFEPVELGVMIPQYKFTGHDVAVPDGGHFVTWEKVRD